MSENQFSLDGIKVAVVDDSKTIRRTAETLLKKAGCEVRLAEDGFAALHVCVSFRPDIIFIDVMMPRLDGYKTVGLLKKNVMFRDTPIVMLSSKDGAFDRARGRMVGADEYVTKPFTMAELLSAIQSNVKHLEK